MYLKLDASQMEDFCAFAQAVAKATADQDAEKRLDRIKQLPETLDNLIYKHNYDFYGDKENNNC